MLPIHEKTAIGTVWNENSIEDSMAPQNGERVIFILENYTGPVYDNDIAYDFFCKNISQTKS